jgi:hypothetical protein
MKSFKNLTIGLIAISALLCFATQSLALQFGNQYDFFEEIDLDEYTKLGKNDEDTRQGGIEEWFHTTPSDLNVPTDTVTAADLFLKMTLYKDVDGLSVAVVEDAILKFDISADNNVGYKYTSDLLGAFLVNWSMGDKLHVYFEWQAHDTFKTNGDVDQDAWINLSRSAIGIDYGNGTKPVPEPATMLLFGTGLIGLAGFSIRRKKK